MATLYAMGGGAGPEGSLGGNDGQKEALPTIANPRSNKTRGNMVNIKSIDASDPMGIKQSIFGKSRTNQIDLDIYQKILVSHKHFDPKVFLKAVHNHTSYHEITDVGCRNLQQSIDKRAEVMKDLVKQHFAKFVNAKSTIDSFYDEMKTNNLISSDTQGIAPYIKSLDALAISSKDIYGPLLERKEKAEKIRTALSLLDQWKFFFNLPSSLLDSIRKEKFDAAVRDYNKGKYLMKSSFSLQEDAGTNSDQPGSATASTIILNQKTNNPPISGEHFAAKEHRESEPRNARDSLQLANSVSVVPSAPPPPPPASTMPFASSGSKPNTKDMLLPETYQKVFEHVWVEVENITDMFRKSLFDELTKSAQPLDVQERVLRYLVDLNPDKDPVWFYLNHQYESIVNQLTEVYENHLSKMRELKASFMESLKAPTASIPLPKPQYIGYMSNSDEAPEAGGSDVLIKDDEHPRSKFNSQMLDDAMPKPRPRLKSGVYGSLFSTLDGSLVIRKTERLSVLQFRRALGCVHSKEFEVSFMEEYDLQAWKATLKAVRSLCKVMALMQDFWRLCKIFSEDRIQKTNDASSANTKTRRRADIKKMMKCQTMIRNVVELYAKLLSNCFHLDKSCDDLRNAAKDLNSFLTEENSKPDSDPVSKPPASVSNIPENVIGSPIPAGSTQSISKASAAPGSSGSLYADKKETAPLTDSSNDIYTPRFVGSAASYHGSFLATSHPLMASHWATKVMKELVQLFDEVKCFRVGGGTLIEERVLRSIGDVAVGIKKRCVDIICEGFIFESKKFYEFEDWTFDIDQRDSKLHLFDVDVTGGMTPASPKFTLKEENLTTDATQNIKLYYRFLKTIFSSLHKICSAPVGADLAEPTDLNSFTSAAPSAVGIFGVVDTAPVNAPLKHTTIAYQYEPPAASTAVPYQLLDQVVDAFVQSVCEVLDGLEWLATRWGGNNAGFGHVGDSQGSLVVWDESKLEELMLPPHKKFHGEGIGGMIGAAVAVEDANGRKKGGAGARVVVEKKGKVVDTRKSDSRSLVILCNISYLRQNLIPKIVALLELKFKCHVSGDVHYLDDTCNYLNQLLFNNYIRRKSLLISGLVRSGILYSGLDWNELKKPLEIRPYCHEILMCLVMVHAEVSDASQKLVKHILSSLLHSLGLDLLNTFRNIDQFSEVGAMQATLETEFMHQTLTLYESPQIATLYGLIYESIKNATVVIKPLVFVASGLATTTSVSPTMSNDQSLDMVKQYLIKAKQATWMQFMCFRNEEGAGMGGSVSRKETKGDESSAENDVDSGEEVDVVADPVLQEGIRQISPAEVRDEDVRRSGVDFDKLRKSSKPHQ
ncbi:exocyst complex component Sec5-domain-containing protein [Chytriomyces sp. MP71]|nr:exocyst complex component Sec5-domain-containing protein [Chytriomyces sp. MP71]